MNFCRFLTLQKWRTINPFLIVRPRYRFRRSHVNEMQKTPDYTRKAIRDYRQRTKQKQVTFNPKRPDEAKVMKALETETRPFSRLVKELLADHYSDTTKEG